MSRACCLPWTPQQIMDLYGVDVFAETVGKLVHPNPLVIEGLTAKCWQRYRHRCIGDTNYQYWMDNFNDKVLLEWDWYSKVIDKYVTDEILSMDTGTIEDHSTSVASNTDSGLTHTEIENQPNVPVTATKYLDNRSDVEVSGNSTANSENTAISKRSDGLRAETLNKLMEALKSANVAFLRALDPLFMNRW